MHSTYPVVWEKRFLLGLNFHIAYAAKWMEGGDCSHKKRGKQRNRE
jgi:hypothetical protein